MAYSNINVEENECKKNDVCELDNETDINMEDNELINNFVFYHEYNKMSNKMNEFLEIITKNPVILYIILLFTDSLNVFFDSLIMLKLNSLNKYNEFRRKYFNDDKILNVCLINDDNFNEIIHHDIKNIDDKIFEEIFRENNLEINDKSCIMVRYKYDEKIYRLYLNYEDLNDKNYEFPLDIEKIKNNNNEKLERNIINFFSNECSEIEYAYLNDLDIKEIIEECNGPFNDFGLLDYNKIYVKNIMKELNINNLLKFEVKYKNYYLDEDKMELVEHVINIKDENQYMNSDIIEKYIKSK